MGDEARPAMSVARFAAIVAASTSAVLGVLKLTGGTMSGAIAMGASKVTGLGAASADGDAVRREQAQIESIAVPAIAGWTLVGTPTNVTISSRGDLANNRGIQIVATSTVVTPRLVAYWRLGTSVAMRANDSAPAPGYPLGGPMVGLRRASDGVILAVYVGGVGTYRGLRCFNWTDINTIGTARIDRVVNHDWGSDRFVRIRLSAADTVVVETSPNGVDYTQIMSALSVATAMGAGGDPDQVIHGVWTADADSVHCAVFDRGAYS